MGITVDELKDKRPDTTRILNEEKSNYKIISDSIKSLTTEKAVNNVETQKQIAEGLANITNTKLQTEATRQLTDAYKEQNLVIRQKKLNDLADYLKEEGKQVKREIKDTEKQTRTTGDKASGIVSLLGGKVGIALTAITLALDVIFIAYNAHKEKLQKIARDGDEALNTIKQKAAEINQAGKLINDTDTMNKFEQLGEKIGENGENLGLTTDEYKEYNNIANQVADMFPGLVSGFTETGDAILKNKDSVQALRDAYIEQKNAAEVAAAVEAPKIFKAVSQNVETKTFWGVDDAGLKQQEEALNSFLDTISDINNDSPRTDIFDAITQEEKSTPALRQALGDILPLNRNPLLIVEDEIINYIRDNDIETIRSQVQNSLKNLQSQQTAQAEQMKSGISSLIKMTDLYTENKDSQAMIDRIVSSLNADYFNTNGWNMDSYQKLLGDLTKVMNNSSFAWETKNLDELKQNFSEGVKGANYSQFQEAVNAFVLRFPDDLKPIVEEIFSVVGEDKVKSMIDDIKANLTKANDGKELGKEYVNSIIGSLSLPELNALYKLDVDYLKQYINNESLNWEGLYKNVKILSAEYTALGETMDTLKEKMSKLTSAYDTIRTVITEYNTAGMISVDTFQSFLDIEPKMLGVFMNEKGELDLNTESLKENAKAYLRTEMVRKQIDIVNYVASLDSENKQLFLQGIAADKAAEGLEDLLAATIRVQVASQKLTEAEADQLVVYLNAVEGMYNATIKNIDKNGLTGAVTDTIDKTKQLADAERSLKEAREEDALARLEHDLEMREHMLEAYVKKLESIEFDLDLLKDSDYTVLSNYYAEQLSTIKQYGQAIKTEFERVASLPYSTGEEAQAIADTLTSLGESMRSNAQKYAEVSKTIYEAQLNDIVDNAKSSYAAIDRVYDMLERRTSDHDYDNIYSNELRSLLDPLESSLSDLYVFENGLFIDNTKGSLVAKKEEESEEIIKIERETQDTIQKIVADSLQMQYEKNAAERARTIAELEQDLQKIQAEVSHTGDVSSNVAKETADSITNAAHAAATSVQNDLKSTADVAEEQAARVQKAWEDMATLSYNGALLPDNSNQPMAKRFADYATGYNNSLKLYGKVKNNVTGSSISIQNSKWCAEFISDVARQMEIGKDVIPETASVADMKEFFINQGRYSDGWNLRPQVGDIAIAKDAKNSHVGIVIAVDPETNKVTTMEGNHSGMAKTHTVDWGEYWTGFGRPDYSRYEDGGETVEDNEPVVVGEGGRELVYLPSGNAVVLGQNGAEQVILPKGSRIVPHDETERILSDTKTIQDTGTKLAKGASEYSTFAAGMRGYAAYNKRQEVAHKLENGDIPKELENASLTQIEQEIAMSGYNIALQTRNTLDELAKKYAEDVANGLIDFNQEVYQAIIDTVSEQQNQATEYAKQEHNATKSSHEYYKGKMEDEVGDMDHQMQLMRNTLHGDDAPQEMLNNEIELLRQEQEKIHAYAETVREYMRSQGYTEEEIENSSVIQDLQNQWAEVNEKIYDRYNEAIEKATKAMEMQIDTLEYEYEKENLIIDALEKKYQLQRQLREARREIKAEYEASRDIIAIAGDDGTLFNKDDYDTLNKELKKIDSSLTSLYEDYTDAISALGEDEWFRQQEITNEFERQQEALLDQYEIAKQQLEVARQRTKMENIANEKNKRMLIGGKWVQTPDLQALYEAKKELSNLEDEEYELRREAAENKELNALRNLNDTTNTEAKAIQNRINMINKMTSEERKALAEELLKVKDMDKIVDNLGKRTLPDFVKVIKDVIDDLSGFTGIEYSAASEANKTNSRGGSSSSSGTSSALEALRNGDKSTAQSILNNSVGKGSSSSSSGNGGNSIINKVSSAVINTASNVVNTITSGLSNIASKISKEPKHHTGRIRGLKPDEERVIVTKDESILTPAQLSPVAQKLMNATDLIEQLKENAGLLSPTLPSFNVPNVVKNDNSSSQIVEFNGDIIVKEPVQDMNGLLHSVMQEAKLYHLRTKNIR